MCEWSCAAQSAHTRSRGSSYNTHLRVRSPPKSEIFVRAAKNMRCESWFVVVFDVYLVSSRRPSVCCGIWCTYLVVFAQFCSFFVGSNLRCWSFFKCGRFLLVCQSIMLLDSNVTPSGRHHLVAPNRRKSILSLRLRVWCECTIEESAKLWP